MNPAVWEMVEAGGRTAESFGLSRLFGQIYMLLYLNAAPLSLDQLAEHLAVSKASVSIASRQLLKWAAVKKVWVRGDRKDYYEAETDFRTILNGGLLNSLSKKLDSARIQIERSLALVEKASDDPDRQKFLRDRLELAEKRRKRIASVLDNPLLRGML